MIQLGTVLGVSPERTQADEDSIRESWDILAQALDGGTIGDATFDRMIAQEPPDDALPWLRREWARTLRRWAADPQAAAWNEDAWRTYKCPGGCSDTGWVEDAGAAKPCDRCNGGTYRWWRDCYLQRIHDKTHSCPSCTRGRQRTVAEERAEERDEMDDDVLEGLT